MSKALDILREIFNGIADDELADEILLSPMYARLSTEIERLERDSQVLTNVACVLGIPEEWDSDTPVRINEEMFHHRPDPRVSPIGLGYVKVLRERGYHVEDWAQEWAEGVDEDNDN